MPLASFFQTLKAWDKGLFFVLNGAVANPFFDFLMPFMTDKWNFVVPLTILFLYLFLRGGRSKRILLLFSVVLVLLADGTATGLARLFHRARPCQLLDHVRILVGCSSSFTFPSHHATNTFALASFFTYSHRRLGIPLFLLAFFVGFSRIYEGVHYPSDVLGGAVLGIACGLLMAFLAWMIVLVGNLGLTKVSDRWNLLASGPGPAAGPGPEPTEAGKGVSGDVHDVFDGRM